MLKTSIPIYHLWDTETKDIGPKTKDIRHKTMGLISIDWGLKAGKPELMPRKQALTLEDQSL